MTVQISITDDDVFTALRAFLVKVLPAGTEIVQLQDNGVPMPQGPFVGMNNGDNQRLETNTRTYVGGAPGTKKILAPSAYSMNLDFYGPNSGAWAATTQAMFRDEIAVETFPANIVPLYADNPIQLPLISGEQLYEQRWRLKAVMQTNTEITVNQDSATALGVGLVSVERTYPA